MVYDALAIPGLFSAQFARAHAREELSSGPADTRVGPPLARVRPYDSVLPHNPRVGLHCPWSLVGF